MSENNEFKPPQEGSPGENRSPEIEPRNQVVPNPVEENKHLDSIEGTPFEQLSILVKNYDIKEIWQDLQYSNKGVWETLRNISENYSQRQIKAPDEVRDKAKNLTLELMAPAIDLCEFYFPGPLDIANALKEKHTYKTLPEPDNHGKNEPIYQYTDGVYVHAENELKKDAHKEFLNQWETVLQNCTDEIENNGKNANPRAKPIKERLESALHRGPSAYEISEVMDIIRRTTYADPASTNPHSHIPFRNGLLNLDTFKLEPFDPEKFYTYRVEANYLDKYVDLMDAPLFTGYIRSVFDPLDIPMVLQYMGYSLIPGKPRDKVLFIVGREGIGKGVLDRLMEGLLPEGKGAIDLNKLLTSDRFQFSGLDGHVLLTDPEIDRKFRRDAKVSTRNFNTLFGSDTTFNERKFHEGKKQIFFAKGIFLGNLPLFNLNDMAFFRRILLIQTLTARTTTDDPNVHLNILENERDVVTTLLIRYLKILKEYNWIFINEPTKESTAEIWAQFADPIGNFEDECITADASRETPIEDVYQAFNIWCEKKGIPPSPRKTFTTRLFPAFPRGKRGPKGNQHLIFQGMTLDDMDTKNSDSGAGKIAVSRYERYGIHIMYKLLQVRGVIRVPLDSKWDNMWIQGKPIPETPKIAGPEDKKSVSISQRPLENYKSDPQNRDTPNENPTQKNDTGVSKKQNEDEGITLDNGNMIRDQLLALGYLISPDSGLDLSQKFFKIGIMALSRLSDDKKTKLENIMESKKFQVRNDGALGITWFSRPLKKEGEKP